MESLDLQKKIEEFLRDDRDPYNRNNSHFGCGSTSDGSFWKDFTNTHFDGSGYLLDNCDTDCKGGYPVFEGSVDNIFGCGIAAGAGRLDYGADGHIDTISSFITEFEGRNVYMVDHVPTCIESVHIGMSLSYAIGFTVENYWKRYPTVVAKVAGYFAHGDNLRQAVQDAQEKILRNIPIEDRINHFVELYPDIHQLVPNKKLFDAHHYLTGSCFFGRQQFCKGNGINLENSMSVADFIRWTCLEYGDDIIHKLAIAYGREDIFLSARR